MYLKSVDFRTVYRKIPEIDWDRAKRLIENHDSDEKWITIKKCIVFWLDIPFEIHIVSNFFWGGEGVPPPPLPLDFQIWWERALSLTTAIKKRQRGRRKKKNIVSGVMMTKETKRGASSLLSIYPLFSL